MLNLDVLIKLISIILAISLASERLVTFLKTLFTGLAEPPANNPPKRPENDKTRRLIVMGVAFIVAWFTSSFIAIGDKYCIPIFSFSWCPLGTISINGLPNIPVWIMGLLASGGSAYWTNILAYLSAVKDIKKATIIKQNNLNV